MLVKDLLPINSFLNTYFDHIYVVNLKFKITDRLKVSKHLKDHGVDFEIFAATNGYAGEALEKFKEYQKRELGDLERYPEYGEREKQKGLAFIDSAGAMGYIYTYLNILKDAKEKGYKRFLILEDDIILSNSFENEFKNFIQNIDNNWKILQLGATQYGWDGISLKTAEEKGFYLPIYNTDDDYTYGSFAIAIDYTIIDELIEAQSAFEASFDFLPMAELYQRYSGKCFIAYPNIIIPDVSDSSIRKPKPQYTEAKKRKWLLENFDYPLNKPSISIFISSKENLKYYSNFSNSKKLPFSLRLFFNSNHDLRPLHNTELLNKMKNEIQPLNNYSFFSESDYIVTIHEKAILEESDIIKFLEYKVGILEENLTSLKEIKTSQKRVKKGKVSVIIPIYKKTKNLKNALTSVITQDYHDIEIIVVINNKIDTNFIEETRQLILSFNSEAINCHIVLIEHAINNNLSAARNTGIMNSTGEYICFLNDNDIYLQGRLSKSILKLTKMSKVSAAVYCDYTDLDSIDNYSMDYKEGDLTIEILLHAFEKYYLHASTVTYRRDAILNMNGFDESYYYYQDSEFHLRYFQYYTIGYVKECLVQFDSDLSMVNDKIENLGMRESKRKFLNQFSHIALSVIKDQHESLRKQNTLIKKQAQLKTAIKDLVAIRFTLYPFKKIKSYKDLIAIYRDLRL